jgi:endonuclease/exonuclease/phosphatase family metal-dependent hydrolase
MMRLVSYNIHKGIGGTDRRYDLERIVDVLRALEADFICLQEVTFDLPRTSRHDQATLLAERLPTMSSTFQRNVHWKAGGYGNLVLSRWPLDEHHRIALRFEEKKPRGAQLVVAATPEGTLRITNWHLGLSERERHWQAHHLVTHAIFRATNEHPTVMCGDFNDWQDTLADAWLTPRGFTQVTVPAARFRSFPAALPVVSLDKAFHSEGVTVASAHVVRSRSARIASDHLPLVVDFHRRGGTAHGSHR